MENIQATWEEKRQGVWKGYIRFLDTKSQSAGGGGGGEEGEVNVIKEESRCCIL